MSASSVQVVGFASRPSIYYTLAKPDVTFLVVLTTFGGYCLGSASPLNWMRLLNAVIGTMLVGIGTAALNQYVERDADARMRRTANRPLPLGRITPVEVLRFGVATIGAGGIYLAVFTNLLACAIALSTTILYLGVYTPLKKRTTMATAIGAIPGALPPLIGWAAAAGKLSAGAWILFGVLFLWQFPHFFANAWMYREDYSRAGIQMLPVVDPSGDSTFRQIIGAAALLIPVSVLPSALGFAGPGYFFAAVVIGMVLLQVCLWAGRSRTNTRARWLMHATVIHIPVLMGWMIFDKFTR
jgi:protoheme IX farnesyltransferase